MLHNPTEIKLIRQKLGLTQSEFANKAGVSQSMIAKIESGRLDPGFARVQQISQAIDLLQKQKEKVLSEIMERKVFSVTSDIDLTTAISKMKKHGISQLPVIDDGRPVGLLSERNIIEALMHEKRIRKVKDAMSEAPPQLPAGSTVSAANNLLAHFPLLLVSDKGKIKGLVTRADILQKAF